MFTAIEEKQIINLNHQLSRTLSIGLVASQHSSIKQFNEFCDNLTRLAPKIEISKVQTGPQDPPQILIGSGLRYQAIPAGHELQPFLEALIAFDAGAVKLAESIKCRLKEIKFPTSLIVFISPQCTFCPQTVRRLIALPLTAENLRLTIIDGTLFPEMVQIHDIKSVPTLLLEDQFRWTGSIALEELVDAINTRDPLSLRPASLENMIKEGGAGRLAAMMIKSGKLFPAFYDVLTHDKWPIRLGAMVAIEEIAEKKPELAAEALSPLWDRFQHASVQIQGDIIHIFGEIRDPRSVSWLKSVLSGDFDEDVKEAAREAAEKISQTDNESGEAGTK